MGLTAEGKMRLRGKGKLNSTSATCVQAGWLTAVLSLTATHCCDNWYLRRNSRVNDLQEEIWSGWGVPLVIRFCASADRECLMSDRSLSKQSPLLPFRRCWCNVRKTLTSGGNVKYFLSFLSPHPFCTSSFKGFLFVSGKKDKVFWGSISNSALDFLCDWIVGCAFLYLSFLSFKLCY